MNGLMQLLFRLIMVLCLVGGGALLYKSLSEDKPTPKPVAMNQKALALKNYLTKYYKPRSLEINNLTKRLEKDGNEVKQISIPLDPNSKFVVAVDLFTDENDNEAPLIAQVKFIEISSGNKVKEENLNLE